jgi:transcriptional regulator
MYLPPHFKVEEFEVIKDFVAAYPLGNIVSFAEDSLEMSYLPFLLEVEDDKMSLIGHLARSNTQLASLKDTKVLVGFQGPDRYISPTWYVSPNEVPTWNYAAVEVRGRVELIHEYDAIEEILSKSITCFEKRNQTDWVYNLPEDRRQMMVKHIVGIKIPIERIAGNFKHSQNPKTPDEEKVFSLLQASPSTVDHEMFKWKNRLSK